VADLFQRLEDSIESRRLLERGQKILVAVSGGLDSMVLLHALKKISDRHKWRMVVVHFNHQLRGRHSDADERLVRKTAASMKLPVVVGRAEVTAFARKSKLSIEMAARKLRHEFFARVARQRKIETIALAHHADDQVELFFLRLFRGTGCEGLAGMKWKSPSPVEKTISLIRPLLDFSKNELAEPARKNGIRFRHDRSNFSSDFLRNRIRNELLPLLRKKYQPSLNKTVLRLMEIAGAESDYVGETAKQFGRAGLRVGRDAPQRVPENYQDLPLAIQRRILQTQLAALGMGADFGLIELLRAAPDQFVSVGPKIAVARDGWGRVKLRHKFEPEPVADECAVTLSGRAGETVFENAKFNWTFAGGIQKRPSRQRQMELFDADKIGRTIVLRHWHAGDRFWPIGMTTPVKLQDLFTNAKISRERRHRLILATTASGKIFWVEGLRISETFKLTPATKRRLIWKWRFK
jgi:tRNA(Ile)-lysidine synthase